MIYTTIGARATPKSILDEMTKIGSVLRDQGHYLRSGHADGADFAFEKGGLHKCIVYLPWRSFNQQLPMLGIPCLVYSSPELEELVMKFHPKPHTLSESVFNLMLRNGPQVLGLKTDKPSDAVICYTPKGEAGGGTGQAIRIARHYKIPVIDMGLKKFETAEAVLKELNLA